MLHLDSEYRHRYQEYYLATGDVVDSRKYNWRSCEWERVIKIITYIRNQKFIFSCENKPNFKFFMNFRWAGKQAIGNNKFKDIKIWTVGYSDGINCYLEDYDFKLGVKLKEYVTSLSDFKGHIHPRIINLGIIN